jgi:hypothetical protein
VSTESFLPCHELLDVLKPAYAPCPHFQGACSGCAKWNPGTGHIPRGFAGALGRLDEVRLVLLVAEPGDPQPDETYTASADSKTMLEACCKYVLAQFAQGRNQFHRNIRSILDGCWPSLSFQEQMRRTWITETYLCSAPEEGGSVPSKAVRACSCYLQAQLKLLKNCRIVALGGKAQQRASGFPGIFKAVAVAPPGCNKACARASWDSIVGILRTGLPATCPTRSNTEGKGKLSCEPPKPEPAPKQVRPETKILPSQNQTQMALAFIDLLKRPTGRKPRHNGFNILHPNGKRIGFVKYNLDGKYRVYVFPNHSDPLGRFLPQAKNENDRSWAFSSSDKDALNYALEVIRSAFDSI